MKGATMSTKVISLVVFASIAFATVPAPAQTDSSQIDMVPNPEPALACQLLTKKEVLDYIPTRAGVRIGEYDERPSYSSCVWVRNDLDVDRSMEEPFQLTISWERNLTEDYLLDRIRRIGEPVKGIGDKAYWIAGPRPGLVVWYKDEVVTAEIMGGPPNRRASRLAASTALRRIKAGEYKR